MEQRRRGVAWGERGSSKHKGAPSDDDRDTSGRQSHEKRRASWTWWEEPDIFK